MAKILGKWIENGTITEPKLAIHNSPVQDYVLGWDDTNGLIWKVDSTVNDVKVTGADTTPGFLDGKITVEENKLTKTVVNPAGNETLHIGIGTHVFDKSVDTTTEITEGDNLFYTDVRADARITLARGAAGGIAPLDNDTKIPATYLPAIAITETFVVADIDARDALDPDKGDIAIVQDASDDPQVEAGSATYIWDGDAVAPSWHRLLVPDDVVQSVNGETGIVVLNTDHISEPVSSPTNLWFTTTRARESLSSGTGINYNSSTGVIAVDGLGIEHKKVEIITLTSGDISNKFVDLTNVPFTNTAVEVNPVGGPAQEYGADFTVVDIGGDVKRLNWNSLGMDGVITSGDKLIVSYTH